MKNIDATLMALACMQRLLLMEFSKKSIYGIGASAEGSYQLSAESLS